METVFQAIIALAGATPVLLFSYVAVIRRPATAVTSRHCHAATFHTEIWGVHGRYENLLAGLRDKPIRLCYAGSILKGKVRIGADYSISLHDRRHNEIMAIRKSRIGWAIIRLDPSIHGARGFVTPFILYLEARIYN